MCIVFCDVLCPVIYVVFPQMCFWFRCLCEHTLVLSIINLLFVTLWRKRKDCSCWHNRNLTEKVHGSSYMYIYRLVHSPIACPTVVLLVQSTFFHEMWCMCACVWHVRSLGMQGWVSVLITVLIWWVGLVCKLSMLNTCHLAVVNVASMALIVMEMRGYSEFLVELDKRKDTGPICSNIRYK